MKSKMRGVIYIAKLIHSLTGRVSCTFFSLFSFFLGFNKRKSCPAAGRQAAATATSAFRQPPTTLAYRRHG